VVAVAVAVVAGLVALFAAAGRAADPEVTATAADEPDVVTAGLTAAYTFTLDHPGTATLTNTTLVDELPAGAVFVSATASQGSCAESGGTVTCNLGNIPGHTLGVTVEIRFAAPSASFENCGTFSFKEDGNDTDSSHLDTVSACETTDVRAANDPNFRGGCVEAGSTISTGSAATSSDPQNTAVTVGDDTCVTVSEFPASSPSDGCAPGFTCKTEISEILSPPCSVAEPCTVTLTFDGKTFGKVKHVFKDGQLVTPCTDPVAAVPDPCLVSKTQLKGGDTRFVVRYGVDALLRGG
jgi:uncharacterized repeat protein (TIGR01451 family)